MQAITTKYIAPSNMKGSRIKARCQAGSLTLHWDNSLNSEQNHTAAAKALATKLGWGGNWVGGFDHNQAGVYVCEDSRLASGRFNVFDAKTT